MTKSKIIENHFETSTHGVTRIARRSPSFRLENLDDSDPVLSCEYKDGDEFVDDRLEAGL